MKSLISLPWRGCKKYNIVTKYKPDPNFILDNRTNSLYGHPELIKKLEQTTKGGKYV